MKSGSTSQGLEEAQAVLRAAGLAAPPIPNQFARRFKRRGEWCYSSRSLKISPYALDWYVDEAAAGRAPRYVLLAHAGHGVNSWAIHYYLVLPYLQVLLQLAWGGAYMDNAETTASVNDGFRLAHDLVRAVENLRQHSADRLRDPLVVVGSDFYGGYWISPEDQGRARHDTWMPGSPREFLGQALRWSASGPKTAP